jgi:hypothetical protein
LGEGKKLKVKLLDRYTGEELNQIYLQKPDGTPIEFGNAYSFSNYRLSVMDPYDFNKIYIFDLSRYKNNNQAKLN